MQVYKNKWFHRWAAREGLGDQTLLAAVKEMEAGLIDAKLGGHVVKKRVALPGHGKRGKYPQPGGLPAKQQGVLRLRFCKE